MHATITVHAKITVSSTFFLGSAGAELLPPCVAFLLLEGLVEGLLEGPEEIGPAVLLQAHNQQIVTCSPAEEITGAAAV